MARNSETRSPTRLKEAAWNGLAAYPWLVGIGLGILYWIVDSLVEAYIVRQDILGDLLLRPAGFELRGRLEIAALVLIFTLLLARRRRAETALAESRRRAQWMVEHAACVVVMLTADNKIVEFNREAERLYGARRAEVLGQNYCDRFVPENLQEAVAEDLRQVLAGKSMRGHDHVVNTRTGERLLSWYMNRLPRARGEPPMVIAMGHDVTRRVRIEEESRFKSTLLDSAMDSVYVYDFGGRLAYANEAAYETRGYTKDELLSMRLDELVAPAQRPYVQPRLASVVETGSGMFESAHLRKDGTVMPVEINVRVITYAGRKLYVSVARDITERKQLERLSAGLDTINAAINSTLDFDGVMNGTVVEAARAMGCDAASITIRDDRWVVTYVHGLPDVAPGMVITPEEDRCIHVAGTKGEIVICSDAVAEDMVSQAMADRMGIKSCLAMPLRIKDEIVGILDFYYRFEPVGFDDAQVDFAGKLGSSISLALANARLYAGERERARTLQAAILTMPRDVPGVEFGYLYEAARVGGDFYDVFELGPGKVGVTVGDAAGTGIGAAALTLLIKNAIKAYAYDGLEPALAVAKTNELALKAVAVETFATVFFGILDERAGLLTYCCAGHPPPIVKRRATASPLATTAPPIGALPGLDYAQSTERLEPGDSLVLYTDGAIEARRGAELFGDARLVGLVRSSPLGARELPQALLKEIVRFTGGRLSDDVALMAVRAA